MTVKQQAAPPSGMTGIIGAMDVEMERLQALLKDAESRTVSGVLFQRGTLFGRDVVLAVCGVGKCFAALCAEAMILTYSPRRILNIGVAGALSPSLSVGDIAVASGVVQHDMDTTALGDPPAYLSGIGRTVLPCSPALVQALEQAAAAEGLAYAVGLLASGDRFVAGGEEKRRLGERFSAIACEMEGAGVAQTCYVNRVEFALLRSISDSLSGGGMDYERFKELAAARSVAVVSRFLRELR